MTQLALYLLGAPRVVLNGVECYIRRRKGVALLAYLAVTQLPHSRDALATLLWPEFDQTGARDNLRRTLSELHQTLDHNWLAIDRTTIRLRADAEPWVDLWQFHRLLAACQQHGHAKDQICSACLPLLQQAAELYHDDFLAGFTLADSPAFDDWQAQTTAEVRATFAATLARLVDAHVAQRDDAKAIDQARRCVALDPLHEPAQRRLMELYARSNQRTAALRQYEECRQILADELGVLPAPETTALYEQIRKHSIGPDESMSRPAVVTERPRHNLPTQTTSFIGREEEVAQIKRLLDEPGCRLLNLLGPGGIGKTRLALAAAAEMVDRFPDGVFFVPLAPVSQVTDIVPTIAEALRFTFYGSGDPQAQLLDYLRQKTLLLLVDNFEHLLDGVELLSAILRQAPAVTLLATSRERLHLQEEWVYEARGLAFPADTHVAGRANVAAYPAFQLFIQRAQQAETSFQPAVAEMTDILRICQRVEGMPLALELAAPWIRTLRCGEIAAEIEQSLDLLATSLRNIPARHRSLRVVFEQTWRRLSPAEQNVLMYLGVFRGGCTREAVVAVAGATLPVLSSLVDKALLRRTNVGRYEIHELIRQFAETQLHANTTWVEQAIQRHRDYFVDFLATRAAGVKGGRQKETMAAIQADIDNIRLVWRQAVANRDAAVFARTAECLFVYYLYSSGHYEGQNAFQQAASAFIANINAPNHPATSVEPVVLDNQENLAAYLLAGQGYFLGRTRDANRGEILIEQALALLRRSMIADRRTEGFARSWLAWMYLLQGKLEKARECAKSTLTILVEIGDLWAQGFLLILWANTLMEARPLEAEEVYKHGLAVCQQSGDLNMAGYTSMMRSIANMNLGRYVQAKHYIDNTAKNFDELGNRLGMGYCLQRQGELSLLLGDYQQAIQVGRQAVAIFDEVRTEQNVISTQINIAKAYWLAGNHDEAQSLLQQLLQTLAIHNETWQIAHCSFALGCIVYDRGELEQAEQYLNVALAQYQKQGIDGRVADVYRCLGQVMVAYGRERYPEARQCYRQALELTTVHQLAPVALDSCVDVASLLMQTGNLTDAIALLILAQEHEVSTFATKQRARQLLAELSPQGIDATVQSLDLWTVVEELLTALAA